MTETPRPHGPSDDAAPDWALLARYLAGESPAEEERELSEWMAANPADAELLRTLDATISRAVPARAEGAPLDVEGALRRVQGRMDGVTSTSVDERVLPLRRTAAHAAVGRSRTAAWRWGGLAAAAAVVLAVGIASRGEDRSHRIAPAERVVQSPVGARDSVVLPDGSRIVLAPGTRLVVGAGYGDGARDVTLDGEAHFAVRHDQARPFSVRVRGALVRDLGTEFTVRSADSDSDAIAVAVFSGSVELLPDSVRVPASDAAQPPRGGRAGSVVLGPGDRGEVRSDGRVEARRGTAAAEDSAFARGRLVFRGATLTSVRADLRRWYGIDLRIADPALAERRLTASFEGEPVDRVLDVIALAVGAEVERDGKTATLRRAARTPR
jgi:transmembrane sensor